MAIRPSHFNALALARGQTTHKGAVVSATYNPSQAKVLIDHKIDLLGLCALERAFKELSHELREFRKRVEPTVTSCLSDAEKRKGDV